MAGKLLPSDLAPPPVPDDTTMAQRLELWADLVDTCEHFLLEGLRREIGPDGDLQAAYRQWYAERMEEHDRMMFRMLERLSRALPNG